MSNHSATVTNGGKHPELKERTESKTFGAQSSLPRLPIPTLEETLSKLPQVLSAMQTPEEQEETQRIIEEFRSRDGPRLQALLEKYEEEGVASGSLGSYVEEFWNDSYLAPDQVSNLYTSVLSGIAATIQELPSLYYCFEFFVTNI